LGVLNPLVLLHLIGDAHNDGLMLALMCLGLVWAVQRRPLLGTITLVLAVLVKAPAALTLAFAVPIWASQLDGPRPRVRAGLRVVGVAAGTATVVTLMTGTGFGWLRTLGTPTRARTWMSITTDLGYLTGTLTRRLAGFSMDQTRHAFWLAGLVVAGAVSVVLWLRTDRTGPIAGLGLSLAVVVLAGPVVHPWYLLWSVVPLAATAGEAMRRTLMLGTVALVLLVIPTGLQPGLSVLTAALLGVSSVLAIALACREVGRDRPLEPLVVGRPSPRLPWPRRAPVPAASQVGPIRRCGARNDAR
jgi:hypothetical protein